MIPSDLKEKHPIEAGEIEGELVNIKTSEIISNLESDNELMLEQAVVAYFDVMGFSLKKDYDEIRMTLYDFLGPLSIMSNSYDTVRFHIFSDCAILAAGIKNADDLLSVVRFAFKQWTADGLLVRGGIALGDFIETHCAAIDIAKSNLTGSLFFGKGIIDAVALEEDGDASFLYTNESCATFYSEKYGETIYSVNDKSILGWSSDKNDLFWFFGISLLRLLKYLELSEGKDHPVAKKLLLNISYVANLIETPLFRSLLLTILTWERVENSVYEKVKQIFNIKEEEYELYDQFIDEWKKKEVFLKMLFGISHSDSSLP